MNRRSKRKSVEQPMCKYGFCYQKNPEHRKKFRHPEAKLDQKQANISDVSVSPNAEVTNIKPPAKKCRVSEDTDLNKDPVCLKEVSNGHKEKLEPKFSESVQDILKSMPKDFFDFWDFCSSVNDAKPEEYILNSLIVIKCFAELGLHLVGVYDLLSKKLSKDKKVVVHCHYRYYYDPPELQTVVKSDDKDLYHIGYFRDDPDQFPSVLVSNSATIGPKLTLKGDNIFAAMNWEITERLKKLKPKLQKKFSTIQKNLQKLAAQKDYSLEKSTPNTTARNKKVVSKTFNEFGIVVPVKNDIGYRPLPDSNAVIKSNLTKIVSAKDEDTRLNREEKLDELLTNVQFANDECDYGMGFELGIDLFSFGDPYFHSHILNILPLAYSLLNRPKYAEIIQFHLADRKKSVNLNTLG
ncbi:histone PARylation factor 1 [Caerostris extrusa]|uniref:Histone PARylation factor 1 n=1 Tax=Caerostris extrusa TaxID=172846 RepID=A0AAV4WUL1_CAEEX|nr:histone PARylation factor 1 [Caerostris extrusa]